MRYRQRKKGRASLNPVSRCAVITRGRQATIGVDTRACSKPRRRLPSRRRTGGLGRPWWSGRHLAHHLRRRLRSAKIRLAGWQPQRKGWGCRELGASPLRG
jgi:hypothetical protein